MGLIPRQVILEFLCLEKFIEPYFNSDVKLLLKGTRAMPEIVGGMGLNLLQMSALTDQDNWGKKSQNETVFIKLNTRRNPLHDSGTSIVDTALV